MAKTKTYSKAVLEVSNLLVLKYLDESGFTKVSKRLQKLTHTSSRECSKLHFLNLKDVHKFVERKSRPKKRKFRDVIVENVGLENGDKTYESNKSPLHLVQTNSHFQSSGNPMSLVH